MGIRYSMIVLVLIFWAPFCAGEMISMDEDTITEIDPFLNFQDDRIENLTVSEGQYISLDWSENNTLILKPVKDWFGSTSFTISNRTISLEYNISVLPVNDIPVIISIDAPENLTGADNPLIISIESSDPDGDDLITEWFIGKDMMDPVIVNSTFHRYVRPGEKILTVRISDQSGANVTREFKISMNEPPGIGDGPDNGRNRLIFWSIFGSAGIIFGIFSFWIMVKKDDRSGKK